MYRSLPSAPPQLQFETFSGILKVPRVLAVAEMIQRPPGPEP
jgi:hypothetical protein